jgi:hypothetical protein
LHITFQIKNYADVVFSIFNYVACMIIDIDCGF